MWAGKKIEAPFPDLVFRATPSFYFLSFLQMGKITKISLPSSVTADVIRRVENFKNRMYHAVKKNNQTYLNNIHDEVEAFLRDIPGSSIGDKVLLTVVATQQSTTPVSAPTVPVTPAVPVTPTALATVPVDLIDFAAPAQNTASQDEVLVALHRAEHRLTAAKSIIQLGNTVPDAVRTWAVQYVMAEH